MSDETMKSGRGGGGGGGTTFKDAADSVIEFLAKCGEADIEAGIGYIMAIAPDEVRREFKAGIARAIERHLGVVIIQYGPEGPPS